MRLPAVHPVSIFAHDVRHLAQIRGRPGNRLAHRCGARTSQGGGEARAPAGIRTFAVCALIGALAIELGGELVLAAAALVVGALAVSAYRASPRGDPGLTTETALLLTFLLGALATREPMLAAALGVTVAVLLAARTRLHRFVQRVLTEAELHDGLILAAVALVILPLVPDRPIDPFGAVNPKTVWMIVVLMMALSAAGYVAVRVLGPRYGLALAGFASGFVSSIATIGAMGVRASEHPALLRQAAAGGVLSTVATIVQMAMLLAAVSPPTLVVLAPTLACAGLAACIYGAAYTLRSTGAAPTAPEPSGRAFSVRAALGMAALMTTVLFLAAALEAWLGEAGLRVGAALGGFADTHSPAASVGALVAAHRLEPDAAAVPILLALTTNTCTKVVMAVLSGGRDYARLIVPGLLLVATSAWAGYLALW